MIFFIILFFRLSASVSPQAAIGRESPSAVVFTQRCDSAGDDSPGVLLMISFSVFFFFTFTALFM